MTEQLKFWTNGNFSTVNGLDGSCGQTSLQMCRMKRRENVGKPRMIGQFKPFKANRRYNWRWQKKQEERKEPQWQKTTTKPV